MTGSACLGGERHGSAQSAVWDKGTDGEIWGGGWQSSDRQEDSFSNCSFEPHIDLKCFKTSVSCFVTQRPFLVGKARKKTDIAKSCHWEEIVFPDGKIWRTMWRHRKWWCKPSDGWLAVKISIPELSSDNRACDTSPYILSNIYDFTLFILSMMVILIAVYTVVLVLLKDQWWYMWAAHGAMNQEAFYVCGGEECCWAARNPSEQSTCAIGGAHWLDLNQLNTRTHPASSVSTKAQSKRFCLLFAVDIQFHYTCILADPVQSRRIKVKVGKCIKLATKKRFTLIVRFDFFALIWPECSRSLILIKELCNNMLQCASYSVLAKSEYKFQAKNMWPIKCYSIS